MFNQAKQQRAGRVFIPAGPRRAGQPGWDRALHLGDVSHNEGMEFEERRDEIVRLIRECGWLTEDYYELSEVVDELAETEDDEEFNSVWDLICDYAAADRVSIQTH